MKKWLLAAASGALFYLIALCGLPLLTSAMRPKLEEWNELGIRPPPGSPEALGADVAVLWEKHRFLIHQFVFLGCFGLAFLALAVATSVKEWKAARSRPPQP